jgi:hypothetical protein
MTKITWIHGAVFVCVLVELYYADRYEDRWGGQSAEDRGVGGYLSIHNSSSDEENLKFGRDEKLTTIASAGLITLQELVSTSNTTPSHCGQYLFYMDDVIAPTTADVWGRKIPQIVHITSKSRCLSEPFFENANKWRQLQNHSFYFHDDASMDRLLQQEYWPEFPQLSVLRPCLISGAGKADLWRYLLLYRFGGIYTDIDTAPGPQFIHQRDNTTLIGPDDDAFFVVERIGVLSQYFMAASPRHPLLYLAVLNLFQRLLEVDSVAGQYVPYVTGPGALKSAYIRFMAGGGVVSDGYVVGGTYVGHNNRSVTVVGTKRDGDRYVHRDAIDRRLKKEGYELMGMTHFSKVGKNDTSNHLSCYLKLYNEASYNRTE